jgi:hypothetical protein
MHRENTFLKFPFLLIFFYDFLFNLYQYSQCVCAVSIQLSVIGRECERQLHNLSAQEYYSMDQITSLLNQDMYHAHLKPLFKISTTGFRLGQEGERLRALVI